MSQGWSRSFGLFACCSTRFARRRRTGFIFPNRSGGALDLDNLADRVIKPIFEANGMEWKGWQAYRRGFATNPKELGVDDKTIQCIFCASGCEHDAALLHQDNSENGP